MRVEELAAAAGVSVDTVRYYQGRGLLPPPRRAGRVALYDDSHVERLARIRSLAARGLSLATIGRLLRGELDDADAELAAAVAGGDRESFGIEELSRRTGVPVGLLQAVAREGLLVGRDGRFDRGDVEAASAGLRLLEAGLPLPELMELARRHHAAMRAVAESAVALFDAHVRTPLRGEGDLVAAFESLLPAVVALVGYHFERTLLAVATEHIERAGEPAAVRGAS
jgi:DNA-binding transcriptional MerR regulator